MSDRPEMFAPTRRFSGIADSMEPCKMLWADLGAMATKFGLGAEIQSPTGLYDKRLYTVSQIHHTSVHIAAKHRPILKILWEICIITSLLNIPPHLNRVATLPSEI